MIRYAASSAGIVGDRRSVRAIANKIMNGNPKGFFQNAFPGIIGGLVGGFPGDPIGIGGEGWITSILLSVAGSCLVVWLARKIVK